MAFGERVLQRFICDFVTDSLITNFSRLLPPAFPAESTHCKVFLHAAPGQLQLRPAPFDTELERLRESLLQCESARV